MPDIAGVLKPEKIITFKEVFDMQYKSRFTGLVVRDDELFEKIESKIIKSIKEENLMTFSFKKLNEYYGTGTVTMQVYDPYG